MVRTVDGVPRLYERILAHHFAGRRQMAFVAGARQVGKTTTCRKVGTAGLYLSWDDEDDRAVFLKGPKAVLARLGLPRLSRARPLAVFDELHKYARWKSFLKGFFDSHGEKAGVMVTGSSRLDVYRRGGDSLMGRYLLYRMHPLTVAELLAPDVPGEPVREPALLDEARWRALWEHGGFPEPFVSRDARFTRRWRSLRRQQLVREDLRDLTRVHELGQLEVLTSLLAERSSQQLVYSNLANEVRVSVDTIRRWIATLCSLYFGFVVRPWFKNVGKALRREPKWFVRDWSGVEDPGARAETFVACHLLKAVEGWEDLGLGAFELRYLRDKAKREVDFLVVREGEPWLLVEVKRSDTALSPALAHFQAQVRAPHAVQVVIDLDYEDADCFAHHEPLVVPARTFLSQLL